MSKEENASPTNPMLYDPIPEGSGESKKLMQFVAATIICLGAISAGTALAWTSPVLPQIEVAKNINSTLPITAEEGSWVGSFLAIGAFCGALPAGLLADKIGRKFTTIILAVPFIVSWASIIFASSPGFLYFGRFLAGISTGGYCVVCPMYISEIADISVRGTLGSFFQLFLTIGILLVYALGAVANWVVLSAICSLAPILLIVFMFMIPDSPTYYLKQNRRNEAAVALKWFWGPQSNTRTALQDIQNALDSVSGNVSLSDIIGNATNRFALILSLSLMFFQQFSGINAVIFYANKIFDSVGSNMSADTCAITVGVVQVVMTFVSAVLIEKAGRRILLLQSSIVMGMCLIVLGIFFNLKEDVNNTELLKSIAWLPLLSVILFIVSFSLGFGPIPWMMMGELFAPDVKSIASAIAVMFNWTLVFLITKTFDSMLTGLGSDWTFWFFGIFMAVCTVFVAIKVPETKGKSSAEIQVMLSAATERYRKPLSHKYIPMNVDL